jgi:hypothetical protein
MTSRCVKWRTGLNEATNRALRDTLTQNKLSSLLFGMCIINQHDALFFHFIALAHLYMFRAHFNPSSGG